LAKEFFGVQAGGNKQKAVQAFVERNKEDALKTAPKVRFFSYELSHPLVVFQTFPSAVPSFPFLSFPFPSGSLDLDP
jgi:hypothetical protein